ncbi:glycosyltransferase family 39 protein [Luteipulveratus sp. YIM 133132]|uniref:glycosyltransferase family 39 protein n=1 Tax=Luteipulveratus flavus TaxID=3031728 RepID=UPI0023AF22A3|nr:glycosyltransferase family 39 protein [Luteipulveratus sp. YIM 133132]MDE9367563.1 glycosyltransferase family 39 protein [Luteipulveratus sp. YIM 133132]
MTAHRVGSAAPTARLARAPIAVVLLGVAVLLLATSARWGYHRDELYFRAAGYHPAWGYPDQGPLTPLVARAADQLGGGSLVVFRLPGLLCVLVLALVSALIARELGGRTVAQVLTALVVGLGGFPLAVGHILVTATIDVLVWVTVLWLVVRIVRTGQERLWLLVGAIAGLGLLNKALPEVLLLAVVVSLALVPGTRRLLRSRWLWLGLLVAAVMWVPYLLWQAGHGWPQLTFSRQISNEYSALGERIGFVVEQLGMYGLVGAFLWIVGVRRLLRDRSPYRVLVWVWLIGLVVFVVTAGQGYYTAGTYPPLIAAGAVALERRLRRPWIAYVVTVLVAAVMAPAFIPLTSPATVADSPVWSGLGENQLETVGWPQLVDQVAGAYRSLPADARARTAILTDNYGEAGAVDRFGPERGLPRAYSGMNGYGLWGPPPESATTVVGVFQGRPPAPLRDCRRYADVPDHDGVANEESTEAAIYLCRAPAQGWARSWPAFRYLAS